MPVVTRVFVGRAGRFSGWGRGFARSSQRRCAQFSPVWRSLGLTGDVDEQDAIDTARQWLERNRRWLLVFNLDYRSGNSIESQRAGKL